MGKENEACKHINILYNIERLKAKDLKSTGTNSIALLVTITAQNP